MQYVAKCQCPQWVIYQNSTLLIQILLKKTFAHTCNFNKRKTNITLQPNANFRVVVCVGGMKCNLFLYAHANYIASGD
jgi:hypothetical protein